MRRWIRWYQGGRAPYGYSVIDAGPHPNPRKAAEGFRLRVLVIDEPSAAVVRRIFAEYLDSSGDRAIANGLNRDAIPCPSARRPDQNRHRLADGWQGSTVRAILDNPRYTGYAVFGRWRRQEVLADPDDVAAGHVTRFRRADPEHVVRSREQAHPAIVSVETFTQAQLLRASRAAGGLDGRRKLEHGLHPAKHNYVLRGRIRCGYCSRKMEGTPKHGRGYYRCVTRRLAPGSPALATHPRNVYLPERAVLPALNAWIGELFNRDNIGQTVAALLESQEGSHGPAGAEDAEVDRDAVKRRLADAETRLSRLRAAIEAGADPAALVESLNAAQEQRAAAQAELRVTKPDPARLTDAEIYAMVDSLGDVGAALNRANPDRMCKICDSLRLEMVYDHDERAVDAVVKPLGGLVRVSEGRVAHKPPTDAAGQYKIVERVRLGDV